MRPFLNGCEHLFEIFHTALWVHSSLDQSLFNAELIPGISHPLNHFLNGQRVPCTTSNIPIEGAEMTFYDAVIRVIQNNVWNIGDGIADTTLPSLIGQQREKMYIIALQERLNLPQIQLFP